MSRGTYAPPSHVRGSDDGAGGTGRQDQQGYERDQDDLVVLKSGQYAGRDDTTSPLLAPLPRYPQPVPSPYPPPTSHSPSSVPSSTSRLLTYLPLSPTALDFISRNTGLLLVASSQIFFVFMGLSAKFFVSTTSISTLTLIIVRMGMTAFFSLAWLSYTGDPNPVLGPPEPRIRRLLIMRGIFGFGGLFANYQSLRGLSLSDSVTIQFLAPNLTALLGFLVLGETMGWREVVAGLSCLGGVVLVARPPFIFGVSGGGDVGMPEDQGGTIIPGEGSDAGVTHGERIVAVMWAFASLSSATCAYVTIRTIGKQAHAMHSMLYFCYACIITCFIGLVVNIRTFVFLQTWQEFWLIMLIGVFGFIGQMLLTLGLQREKAGRASLAMYLSLLYSLVFELLLFGTIPPFLSLLGAAIIITSAVWVAVSKQKEQPDPGSHIQAEEESLPFSRSPSPSPPGGRTLRRESYPYATVPTEDDRGMVGGNGLGENGRSASGTEGLSVHVDQAGGVRGSLPRRRSGGSGKSGI